MKKMTAKMIECLEWMRETSSEAHDETDTGGFSYRTFNALISRRLVSYSALSTGRDICGGYYLTSVGREIAEKIA